MFTPRDALVFCVTAVACVASIASDSEVSGQARLEGVALEERNIFAFEVTVGPPTPLSALSSLDTTFGAVATVETDTDGAAALEDIAATLFTLNSDGERGDSVDTGAAIAPFTDDDVLFSSSVSTRTKIDDCSCAPCVRRFELELTAPEGFVGVAQVGGGAFNYVSKDITVEMQQVE